MSKNKYGGKGYEEKYLKNELKDDDYGGGRDVKTPTVENNTVIDPAIQQANKLLQQHLANPVGQYSPVWQNKADSYLKMYENRDPFSYDFNADALYNQYKDQYIQQGQMAMMDTMGQAAALTGGYGNSYAQTVGQQAYNQYLGQLNSVMPDLYSMAYDRYRQEGNDLLNMYSLYMDKEQTARNQHQQDVDNWYKKLDSLSKDNEVKYKELDVGSDAYNGILSEIKRVETFDELKNLVNQWLALGYDPDQIEALTASKAKELM